jgi:hypothetical protein
MSDWKAQAARIVLFPIVPGAVPLDSALTLYKAVWQADPDSFQKQVAGSPFATSVAQGTIGRLAVACVAQPIRIDFTLSPSQPSTLLTTIPLIEDAAHFHEQLRHLVETVCNLESSPSINRAACVVQLATITQNIVEANKCIRTILPKQYNLDLSDEEDFVLQVNRARPNKSSKDIRMNFVTKWSVERAQILTFANFPPLNAASGQAIPGSQMIQEFIVAGVTFDNSNAPLQRPMSKQEKKEILTDCLQGTAAQMHEFNIAVEGY